MILSRLSLVRALFAGDDRSAVPAARRWRAARAANPALMADLIRHGGILAQQPQRLTDGVPEMDQTDPIRLAYEAGRRDMALALLALMGLSDHELSQMMEANDVLD